MQRTFKNNCQAHQTPSHDQFSESDRIDHFNFRWSLQENRYQDNTDKQIRFDFPGVGTHNVKPWITYGALNHYKFNMDYYHGVDSVILWTWVNISKPGVKGTIELYNVTDSIPIPGSLIEVSSGTFFQSGNLKNHFPHKEITLALRLKSLTQDEFVEFTKTSLFIYRK